MASSKVLAVVALAVAALAALSSAQKIQQYNVDKYACSASGVSAGAYMAAQVYVAFSEYFIGAGLIAGGPYNCAEGQMYKAVSNCMSYPGGIDVSALLSETRSFYSSKTIDNPDNLKASRLWMYSGTKDTVVLPGVMQKAYDYFSSLVPASNISFIKDMASEHAWITDNYGSSCATKGSPYINNCNYDASSKMYSWIYGDLSPKGSMISSNLLTFDQASYVSGSLSAASLGSKGYLYVPTDCQKGAKCRVTFAFHGCEQTTSDIGDKFYTHTGINEWAETNRIIVVYPQAIKASYSPVNPKGCFDWWGYASADYQKKTGPQMAMVKNILDALAGK